MIDGIPLSGVELTASALLAITVLMILTGKLLWHGAVKSRVEEIRQAHREAIVALDKAHDATVAAMKDAADLAIADRDRQIVDWRDTARLEGERADILAKGIDELGAVGRATQHVLESLRNVAATTTTPQGGTQ